MSAWADRFRAAAELAGAAWRWLVFLGLAVAVVLLVRACSGERAAAAEVARLKEAAELERAGFLVAQRARQTELDLAASRIPALEAEIARLKKASPGARIVRVVQVRTAPALAEGIPLPEPQAGKPCPKCMFAEGNTGDIRIGSIDVETRKGNDIALVAAECWRLTPTPETKILSGLASASLSRILTEIPPPEPGWGGAILVGISTTGVVGTAQGFTPPLFLDHLAITGALSVGQGPSGSLQAGFAWR